MQKKIIVVNAGPRKGWNTDTLITEAAQGASDAGAQIERFDLFKMDRGVPVGAAFRPPEPVPPVTRSGRPFHKCEAMSCRMSILV